MEIFKDFSCIMYMSSSKVTSFQKNQRILGVLEPITAFHANRDGYSEIYKTFVPFLRVRKMDKTCIMVKTKAQVLREILSNVSPNVEGPKKISRKDWNKFVREKKFQ